MTNGLQDMNAKPTETISVREVFGIDTDMTVKGFAEGSDRVPAMDSTYKFDPDTTMARAKDRELARRAMLGQARLLRRMGRRDEARALLETLATEQGQGQDEAKRALGQGGEKGQIAELIANARSSRAMEELVWIGESAVPELIAVIDEASKRSVPINRSGARVPRELKSCTQVLLRIGGKQAEAWLTGVVEKGTATARATVLDALSSQSNPELLRIATGSADVFVNDAGAVGSGQ